MARIPGNDGVAGQIIPPTVEGVSILSFTGVEPDYFWAHIGIQTNSSPSLIGVTSITYNPTSMHEAFTLQFAQELTTLSFPNLVEASEGNVGISIYHCYALTEIDLSQLVNLEGPLQIYDCPSLTTVHLDSWVPRPYTGDYWFEFQDCALSEANVNAILAKFVAVPEIASGVIIRLGGGTNAAPSGQGITDADALVTRGVTLTTN